MTERPGETEPDGRPRDWLNDTQLGYSAIEYGGPDPSAVTGNDGRGWLVVFTDVITLLLAFLVLVYAMQGVQYDQWQITVDSLTRTLKPNPPNPVLPRSERRLDRDTEPGGADLDYLRSVVSETAETLPALSGIGIRRAGPRLILSLPSAALFTADGDISGAGRERVVAIATILRNLDNAVGVVGVAGTGGGTQSGAQRWSRALDQADAVATVLRTGGYGRPLEILARWTGVDGDRVEITVMSTEAAP